MTLKQSIFLFFLFITPLYSVESEYKHVFVDGTFDLAHYGHQQVIQNAKKYGACFFNLPENKIRVIVGVSGSDEEIASYKRKPVYTIEEKMRQISGFQGVYQVINSPMITTDEFVKIHHIDLVVAGSDYAIHEKAIKYYQAPIEQEIFLTFPRTEGISTTNIMRRVVDSVADTIIKNLDPNSPQYESDKATVQQFLELQKKYF